MYICMYIMYIVHSTYLLYNGRGREVEAYAVQTMFILRQPPPDVTMPEFCLPAFSKCRGDNSDSDRVKHCQITLCFCIMCRTCTI